MTTLQWLALHELRSTIIHHYLIVSPLCYESFRKILTAMVVVARSWISCGEPELCRCELICFVVYVIVCR